MELSQTVDFEAEKLLTELCNYMPELMVNGPFGVRWGYREGILDLAYLNELTKVRRLQFLHGQISPDMAA